jgi:hypothetical protein
MTRPSCRRCSPRRWPATTSSSARAMAGDGRRGEGLSKAREARQPLATRLSSLLTGQSLSDPMSGFFLMRREVFDEVAPTLSEDGFKILLDIIVSADALRTRSTARRCDRRGALHLPPAPCRREQDEPAGRRAVPRAAALQADRGLLPTSFLLFGLVGGLGVIVHMGTLWRRPRAAGLQLLLGADGGGDRRHDLQLHAQQRADLCQQEAQGLALSHRPADLLRGLLDRRGGQRLGGELDLCLRRLSSTSPACSAC